MTDDNFGAETHDHDAVHETALSSEHEGVSEPPSDYEFADETGATADVEHSDEQMPAEEQPARRSPLVPIVAAVGGVLVLGAVGWWQFSGQPATSNATLSAMTSASLNITPSARSVHTAPPAAPTGPAASAQVLPITPKMDMAPPELAPADTAAALPTDSIKSATVSAPVSTAMPVVVPASALPATAPIATPVSVLPPPAPPAPLIAPLSAAAANAVPPFAATATNQSDNQRIDTLNARIDTLQKALDQANQQLSQVTNMVAASASPSSAPSSKEMQDKIDRLERQVASLNPGAPVLSVPAASADKKISEPKPVAPAHTHVHKAVHKAQAHKPVVKKTAAPSGPQWVLRAATPGQAWVASNESTHDLKPVKVGDELAGIGRVTAIQQQDGNWIVQGSKGKIQ